MWGVCAFLYVCVGGGRGRGRKVFGDEGERVNLVLRARFIINNFAVEQ